MPWFHPKTLLDKVYEIGIIIKGIDGSVELIGGVLILSLSSATVLSITKFLSEHSPQGFIADGITSYGADLAAGHTLFAALFLLTHGLVKVVLVVCLLLNKLWAYPWALGALGLFLIYQMYLLITKPTFGMAFLTALDIVIIGLVYREWQQVKPKPTTAIPE